MFCDQCLIGLSNDRVSKQIVRRSGLNEDSRPSCGQIPIGFIETIALYAHALRTIGLSQTLDAAFDKDFLDPLKAASKDLQAAGMYFMQNGMTNPNHALAGSNDFMHMFGHVCLGLMWALMAKA